MRREEQLDNLIRENQELKEALERARTYTGLEAAGCPLCTYTEGVFVASCSFHRQIEAMHAVVEAAKWWKEKEKWPYLGCSPLANALDAYEKVQPEEQESCMPTAQYLRISKIVREFSGACSMHSITDCRTCGQPSEK